MPGGLSPLPPPYLVVYPPYRLCALCGGKVKEKRTRTPIVFLQDATLRAGHTSY